MSESGELLKAKQKNPQLNWLPDERFVALGTNMQKELLNPQRNIIIPGAPVTNHILRNAAMVLQGNLQLYSQKLDRGDPINLTKKKVDDLLESYELIWGFLESYHIVAALPIQNLNRHK